MKTWRIEKRTGQPGSAKKVAHYRWSLAEPCRGASTVVMTTSISPASPSGEKNCPPATPLRGRDRNAGRTGCQTSLTAKILGCFPLSHFRPGRRSPGPAILPPPTPTICQCLPSLADMPNADVPSSGGGGNDFRRRRECSQRKACVNVGVGAGAGSGARRPCSNAQCSRVIPC